jgi:WD40 repeat protein
LQIDSETTVVNKEIMKNLVNGLPLETGGGMAFVHHSMRVLRVIKLLTLGYLFLFLFPLPSSGQVEKISSEGVGLLQYRLRPMNMKVKSDVDLNLNKGFNLDESRRFSISATSSLEIQYDPVKTHKEDIYLIVMIKSNIQVTHYDWVNGRPVKRFTSKEHAPVSFSFESVETDGKKNPSFTEHYGYFGQKASSLYSDYYYFKLSRELLDEIINANTMTFKFSSGSGNIFLTFNDLKKFKLLDEAVKSNPYWAYSQPGFEQLPPLNADDFFKTPAPEKSKASKSILNIRDINLYNHSELVTEVAISTDGNTIASGSWDGYVTFWDPKTREHIASAQKAGLIAQIIFHPTEKIIVTRPLFDNSVMVWNSKDGSLLHTLAGHDGSIKDMAFNSNGDYLATASHDKVIKLWDIKSGSLVSTFNGHSGYVNAVRFIQGGDILISGSADKTLRLWDVKQNKQIAVFTELNEPVEFIEISHDESLLSAVAVNGKIGLWDLEKNEYLFELDGHSKSVRDVLFCPADTLLATCSEDKTIKLWNTANGKLVYNLKGHKDFVKDITFSPDGKILASGSYDKTIILWRVESGKAILSLSGHNHSVNSIVFNHEGDVIVSGSADKTVRWWELPFGVW